MNSKLIKSTIKLWLCWFIYN